jgi:outer membrane protein, heavy metal efflux system
VRRTVLPIHWPTTIWTVPVFMALLVVGCVHFEPKPLDVTKTANDFDQRKLDAPELRVFLETNLSQIPRWPLPQWSFEQLALAALFYHPKLDVARAQLASARAAEITAGARPNPTIGVTPEYTVNAASGVSPWIATVQLDVPIETAGKRGHRIDRARQLSEASRFDLISAAWEVRSSVRTAWLELCDAVQQTNLLALQLVAQQRVLSSLELKLRLGAATASEIAFVRVALTRTRKDHTDARVQVNEAQARLAAALGVPLKSLPSPAALTADTTLPQTMQDGEARHRALTARADMLATLAGYAAAETTLKLEIAKQYPDVHLGTGYQFDQGENKWALGLSADIPVLNRNQGPVAEAEAKRAEAAARVLALQARIVGDVDRVLAGWQGAQSRLTALNELRAAQKARLFSLQAQFDAGAVEALDIRLAEVELATNELLHWDAQLKTLRAFGDLEDAAQFPLSFDVTLNPRTFR